MIPQILDFFYPRSCVICKKVGGFLCEDCIPLLREVPGSFCSICGTPFVSMVKPHPCAKCVKERPHYDKHRSVFVFGEESQKLIHLFKYHSQFWLKKVFVSYFEKIKGEFSEVDCIIPVPLHGTQLRKRGFNQSLHIAKLWGSLLSKPVQKNALVRKRMTRSQTGLTRSDRQKNIRGAFDTRSGFRFLKNKTVMLVDDVHTTGVTLNESAKVLKEAGARKVLAFSVAVVS